jgi:hypothetical protein
VNQAAHRIRRQSWIVRTHSAAAGFELRRKLRMDWEGTLLASFERAFDRVADGQVVIRIPRIELHLKLSELGKEMPADLIDRQLTEQLPQRCRAQPRHDEEHARWKKSSTRQARGEALLHYLRTGALPWEWAEHGSVGSLAVTLAEICREESQALHGIAINEPPAPAFFFRWFQLLARAETAHMIRRLFAGATQPWVTPCIEVLSTLLDSGANHFSRHLQLELVSACLSEALARREEPTGPQLAMLVASHPSFKFSSTALVDFLESLPPGLAMVLREGQSPGDGINSLCEGEAPAGSARPRERGPATEQEVPRLLPCEGPQAVDVFPPARPCSEEEEADLPRYRQCPDAALPTLRLPAKEGAGFPFLVNHAGLVLLHPFLPSFFEATGLKTGEHWQVSGFGLARAAALLFFIASGREDIHEYDLGLVKVLLGLRPVAPLCVAEGLISASDRAACDGLLQTVIAHWSALKRTSIAGFRASFLERQGLLRQQGHGWKLQIERVAYDVLRDQLPWAISVFKLPWMKDPLYTEW